MTLINGRMAALLAELEQETTRIIAKHFDADEKEENQTLKHFAPISIEVHTVDGRTAVFYEDGIDLYPEDKSEGSS